MKMGKCEKEVADWLAFIREWLEKTIDVSQGDILCCVVSKNFFLGC